MRPSAAALLSRWRRPPSRAASRFTRGSTRIVAPRSAVIAPGRHDRGIEAPRVERDPVVPVRRRRIGDHAHRGAAATTGKFSAADPARHRLRTPRHLLGLPSASCSCSCSRHGPPSCSGRREFARAVLPHADAGRARRAVRSVLARRKTQAGRAIRIIECEIGMGQIEDIGNRFRQPAFALLVGGSLCNRSYNIAHHFSIFLITAMACFKYGACLKMR